jgi:cytidine deaminase
MTVERESHDEPRSGDEGSPRSRLRRPELVVAVVGAVGTPMTEVVGLLRTSFSRFQYESTEIRLIRECLDKAGGDFWKQVWSQYSTSLPHPDDGAHWWRYSGPKDRPPSKEVAEHIRRKAYMDAGKVARSRFKDHKRQSRELEGGTTRDTGADALAWMAITRIRELRRDMQQTAGGAATDSPRVPEAMPYNERLDRPLSGQVFIIRSLKNQEEAYVLQRVYGPGFFVVGLYSAEHTRRLATEGQLQSGLPDARAVKPVADYLVNRDFHESVDDQNVRDTFGLADLFLDTDQRESMSVEIDRFLDLLFSRPDITPTRSEYGMALAHTAAATSGALPRQVGAAITTDGGEVVALGRNEVPNPKGGLLSAEDVPTWAHIRDLNSPRRRDSSHDIKKEQIGKAIRDLREKGLLRKTASDDDARKALERSALVRDVIEFHPELHAEMSAIVSAARMGAAVEGCRLFTTVYPCHNCARLIMGAGLCEVVYIEAYPKSRARELYNDGFGSGTGVRTTPFVGIAPRRYRDIFALSNNEGDVIERRNDDGEVTPWSAGEASFRWRTWAAGCGPYEALIDDLVTRFQDGLSNQKRKAKKEKKR